MPTPISTPTIGTSRSGHLLASAGWIARHGRTGSGTSGAERRSAPLRRRLAPIGALVAVAVVAAACSSGASSTSSSASATKTATHAHHHAGISGLVSAVSPGSMTLDVKGVSSTFALGSTTKFREAGSTVTASALVAGDHVRVRLATGASAPTAAVVVIAPPSVTGTVGSLGTSGFTLTTHGGTARSVTTTSTTVYHSGKQTVSVSSLHSGDRARVAGQTGPSGAITATTVTILPAKKG